MIHKCFCNPICLFLVLFFFFLFELDLLRKVSYLRNKSLNELLDFLNLLFKVKILLHLVVEQCVYKCYEKKLLI